MYLVEMTVMLPVRMVFDAEGMVRGERSLAPTLTLSPGASTLTPGPSPLQGEGRKQGEGGIEAVWRRDGKATKAGLLGFLEREIREAEVHFGALDVEDLRGLVEMLRGASEKVLMERVRFETGYEGVTRRRGGAEGNAPGTGLGAKQGDAPGTGPGAKLEDVLGEFGELVLEHERMKGRESVK